MFKRIIWATDGSEASDLAMPFAKDLATDNGGEVIVVHCTELMLPGKGGGSYPRNAEEDVVKAKIERQAEDLLSAGVRTTVEIATSKVGEAAEVIAAAAKSDQADVIVIGTPGHTALGGLLVGSVSQHLLRLAPCPVLVVPARDGQG